MQPSPGCAPLIAPEGFIGGGPIWYGGADYLLYKVENGRIPTTASVVPVGLIAVDITNLVTNNPPTPGTPFGTGTTGFAPVSIQSAGRFATGLKTDSGSQNGGRVTAGYWLDPDQSFGLEASGFYLEQGSTTFAALTGQAPGQFLLDTGFTKTLFLNTAGALSPLSTFNVFVARQTTASLSGSTANQLYGTELNARTTYVRIGGTDIGFLAGVRYLRFEDELSLSNNVRFNLPPGIPQTTADLTASLSRDLSFNSTDHIRVQNHFYGGQIGADIDSKFGSFYVYARGKVAIGDMHQAIDINSQTTIVNNDLPRSPPSTATGGGLLTGPNDNGRHTRNSFAVIPEVEAKLGYQFTDWLRGYVGYNGILLGDAQRAGGSSGVSTLNTNITVANSATNVNVAQPTFRFENTSVYIQGVTFGFEAKY